MARTVATTRFTSKNYGMSISLNGSSDYIAYPMSSSLNIQGTAISVCGRIFPTVNTANKSIVVFGNAGFQKFMVMLQGLNNGVLRFELNTGTNTGFTGTTRIPINKWSHFACIYDGTNVTLYLNGVQESQTAYTGNIVSVATNATVGARVGNGEFFAGQIDDIQVYNVALTPSQVDKQYHGFNLGIPSNLKTWWEFNEGTGTSSLDSSGNNNNSSSFIGTPSWSTNVFSTGRVIPSNVIGTALSLNGSPDKIVFGNVLASNTAVTACFWFNLPSTPGGSYEIPFGYGNSHWFFIFNPTSTQISFHIVNSTGEKSSGTSSFVPLLNTWYFLSGTYDPAVGTGNLTMRIYDVNGVLLGSSSSTQTGNMSAPNGGGQLEIGHDPRRGIYNKIIVDDPRVYSVALAVTEQSNIASRIDISTQYLSARWPLDEGSGAVASDAQGGYDGVITGSTYVPGIIKKFQPRSQAV